MEISECPKKFSSKINPDVTIFGVEDHSLGRIMNFLDIGSKLELRMASKQTNKLVMIFGGWSFALMSLFIPDLDLTEDAEDSEKEKPQSNYRFGSLIGRHLSIKNKNNRLWFSYFRTVSCLAGNISLGSDIDSLIQAISKTLLLELKTKDAPEVVLMKNYPLVRTTSSFQRYLLDRLRLDNLEAEEEPPGLGFGVLDLPPDDETAEKLEEWVYENQSEIEAMAAEEDLQTLLKLRWYMHDSAYGDILDITEIDDPMALVKRKSIGNVDTDITMSLTYSNVQTKEYNNSYLAIFLHINKVVRWYCKLVSLTISNQNPAASKLKLYSELLKRFTYVCESFSKTYSFLEKSLNAVFKVKYPNYPCFPKFSFWRSFMRIWIEEVYRDLEEELTEDCMKTLLRIRQTNFLKCLSETELSNESQLDSAKAKLHEKNTIISSLFPSNQADLDLSTVQEYLSALSDISLHEVSIHYLPHSKAIGGESPYSLYEEKFIKESVDFCLAHFDLLNRNLGIFEKFLEVESGLISQVCLNRTYLKYYYQVCTAFLRKIEQEITRIAEGDGTQDSHLTMREINPEDNKRIQILSEIVCYNKCPEYKRPFETQGFEDIMCNRSNSISVEECQEVANSLWSCSAPELLNVIDLYAFVESKIKGVTSKFRQMDDQVQNHNEEMGVPFDLANVEPLFSFNSKLTNAHFEELMSSVQPEVVENHEGFAALSANLSHATWNDDNSEEEPFGDEYVLVGIERTVSKLA